MTRGRRALPDAVKALKGNPGKRRLALEKTTGARSARVAPPKAFTAEPPDYLTQEGEKAAFVEILKAMPLNVARKSDIHAIARWAAWLYIWIDAKKRLDGHVHYYENKSKHGTFLREHPISKRMHQAEAHLISLEDRLGLNIVARNNIVHRLFNMPGPPPRLFDDPEPEDGKPLPIDDAPEPEELSSPLNFLSDASKPASKPN
jgi:phage terminase small subunit